MPSSVVGWFVTKGVVALPGYSVFILPWMGSKANTGWSDRTQSSARLGGCVLKTSGGQNNEISWDVWLDAGTYKFALVHDTETGVGIYSVQLDAVEKGTIDGYAAVGANNVYSEITGIVVAGGIKTFKLKMATKNASAIGFYGQIESCAWIRTGA